MLRNCDRPPNKNICSAAMDCGSGEGECASLLRQIGEHEALQLPEILLGNLEAKAHHGSNSLGKPVVDELKVCHQVIDARIPILRVPREAPPGLTE